jgi:hypothetical protein
VTRETDDALLQLRARALDDPDVPEGIRRALDAGAQLERIHLDARGRWTHEGERFENRRLSALFHRSVARTPAGLWLLTIAPYSYPITVEDAGWFITRIIEGPELQAELAGGEVATIDADAFSTDGQDHVYATLWDGRRARLIDAAWRWVEAGLVEQGGRWAVALPDGRSCALHPLLPS